MVKSLTIGKLPTGDAFNSRTSTATGLGFRSHPLITAILAMMEQIVTVSPLDFSFPAFDILGIRILRHHNIAKVGLNRTKNVGQEGNREQGTGNREGIFS
jgi:hypothetical protein